jgi:energy-coupling factor transporter ATP-binding protein EcfA2
MTFPYLSQIKVNNCFTYRDFLIPNVELSQFKHIILTGKNGSGKTTILNRIAFILSQLQAGKSNAELIQHLQRTIQANQKHQSRPIWEQQISEAEDIDLKHLGGLDSFLKENSDGYIFSFFKAHRKVELKLVNTVTKEDEFLLNLKNQNKTDDFISQFKQYLVNKKVYEAFDFMNSKSEKINQSKLFFENLTQTLVV